MTRPDERNVNPATVKREHDEKILKDAKKMKMGEDGHAAEVKTVADQQAKIIRQTLEPHSKSSSPI